MPTAIRHPLVASAAIGALCEGGPKTGVLGQGTVQ